jgi:hypothetical protein
LQVWYIFDGIDGEIARYKKQTSLTGAYFDILVHYIIHPYIFVCIGLGLYRDTSNLSLLLLGVLAGISVILIPILHDLKNTVLFNAGLTKKEREDGAIANKDNLLNIAKFIFSFLHKLCTYPSIMNIITIVAILDYIFKWHIFYYLIIFYGLVCPFIWISKLILNINKKILDTSVS